MDHVDPMREYLTSEDFIDLKSFSIHGCPAIVSDLLSRFSGQSFEKLLAKRLRLISKVV